jgi:hypothetical protein
VPLGWAAFVVGGLDGAWCQAGGEEENFTQFLRFQLKISIINMELVTEA